MKAWDNGPRTRARSDRPLQRSLVFAVAARAASDAKALALLERAVDDGGEGDDIPDAIPRWAAALLYHLRGVECEPVLLKVMASPRPGARRPRRASSTSRARRRRSRRSTSRSPIRTPRSGSRPRPPSDAAGARRESTPRARPSRSLARRARGRRRGAHAHRRSRSPALVKLLEDKDWRTRANASVVLVRNGTAAELARVAALEKDPEDLVRDLAVQAKAILEARARAAEAAKDKAKK